ncbi:MAG: hemerythrin domain-containing protein [Bacillus sp. (in: Bacteria)]|nr:hemerythrin domain-containing protein [Bacillus sp. (in: firmicutes)]
MNEHIYLKNKLDKLYHLASMLAYDPSREDRLLLLDKLYNALGQFKTELDSHSQKEDNYLFDLVAEHIGREEGPIVVMEEDHITAKAKIHEFLRKYQELDRENPDDDIRELTNYVSVIFHTLTDHFLKEEEILFPMAENNFDRSREKNT